MRDLQLTNHKINSEGLSPRAEPNTVKTHKVNIIPSPEDLATRKRDCGSLKALQRPHKMGPTLVILQSSAKPCYESPPTKVILPPHNPCQARKPKKSPPQIRLALRFEVEQ